MSQHITRNDPPEVCDTYKCMNDAHVALYSAAKGWFRVCPSCLDELNRLQAGVTLPEQRGHVIDLHSRGQTSTSTGDAQTLLDRWGLKQ